MHDLPLAKYEARRYVKRLKEDFYSEYPGIVRPEATNGKVFFDA
jgi:S-ribosylhomocysteine lyase